MASSLAIPVAPELVWVTATGGEARERAEWVAGEATGRPMLRGGAAVHRLTGVAVSVAGTGLDGAAVETCTPMTEVQAGTIFRAEGEVEIRVRADAQAGFRAGDRPRGSLHCVVWVERLVPVGSIEELLRRAGKPGQAQGQAS